MSFDSYTFGLFFLLVLFLHRLPFSWKFKKLNLLWASYIFYAAWNPPMVVLLWISTITDWWVGRWLYVTRGESKRRLLLTVSLLVNLGMLSYFKYASFLLDNFVAFVSMLGVAYRPPELDIVLPVGISFFVFQSLSYTFDIYRRREHPTDSFFDYALFVTFFPQLVAGPIVRSATFLPQLGEPRRADAAQLSWGFLLMIVGLFQKVCLADNLLAPVTEAVYDNDVLSNTASAWLGTMAFAGQIYCDFAGYSTTAIGAALCLGFSIPDNFRFPYAACGFSDFWRRWHISLSGWLRDYLYISLGGNRMGQLRTSVNLMMTMLIGGLWHGASWNFVIWGGLHGLYLIVERWIRNLIPEFEGLTGSLLRLVAIVVTFLFTCFAWVFFRASAFGDAIAIQSSLLGMPGEGAEMTVSGSRAMSTVAVVGSILLVHYALRGISLEEFMRRSPLFVRWLIVGLMLFAIAVSTGEDRAFIYFQF
ncbi:MBOAT family O-acyltransferase [Mucisphaera calidilacus]|uniref:Peptidoglycan O-acetyltransferase n=1 Tax=Mucisphaera calidilacus TaxID=2527982 RepID=A0A518BXB2_9BACT|nr:MBOAT family O-acyltransferase [Mucisphaera calidilacus]QDU71621.1 Peptidoglycan O-acetyltransferase [Mucisphaera calidilacus]